MGGCERLGRLLARRLKRKMVHKYIERGLEPPPYGHGYAQPNTAPNRGLT